MVLPTPCGSEFRKPDQLEAGHDKVSLLMKEILADLQQAAKAENVDPRNMASRMSIFMTENRQQGNVVQQQGNAGCTIL
jgi:hypothetical protein